MLTHGQIDILFSASEDCTPLWEAKWEAAPESQRLSDAQRIQRGQEAIRRLLADGLIALYRCRSWQHTQEMPVPPEEWEGVVADVSNWRSSMEDDEAETVSQAIFCFFITDKGKDYYIHAPEVTAYHQTKWYSAHSRM
ncbi:MAG: hypothetical protein JO250_09515 [Armatimonadetes bacterium]|nr:hypothetical protein [Armatimonadota bacterium]